MTRVGQITLVLLCRSSIDVFPDFHWSACYHLLSEELLDPYFFKYFNIYIWSPVLSHYLLHGRQKGHSERQKGHIMDAAMLEEEMEIDRYLHKELVNIRITDTCLKYVLIITFWTTLISHKVGSTLSCCSQSSSSRRKGWSRFSTWDSSQKANCFVPKKVGYRLNPCAGFLFSNLQLFFPNLAEDFLKVQSQQPSTALLPLALAVSRLNAALYACLTAHWGLHKPPGFVIYSYYINRKRLSGIDNPQCMVHGQHSVCES